MTVTGVEHSYLISQCREFTDFKLDEVSLGYEGFDIVQIRLTLKGQKDSIPYCHLAVKIYDDAGMVIEYKDWPTDKNEMYEEAWLYYHGLEHTVAIGEVMY